MIPVHGKGDAIGKHRGQSSLDRRLDPVRQHSLVSARKHCNVLRHSPYHAIINIRGCDCVRNRPRYPSPARQEAAAPQAGGHHSVRRLAPRYSNPSIDTLAVVISVGHRISVRPFATAIFCVPLTEYVTTPPPIAPRRFWPHNLRPFSASST